MRYLALFIFVFGFSIYSVGQSVQDQSIFKNKIWKVISVSNNEQSFYDTKDNFLGSRLESTQKIVYRDKWKRTIRVVAKPKAVIIKKNIASKPAKPVVKKAVKDMQVDQIRVRRNKATFLNAKGEEIRTAKRRGKRVFFHDEKGKLIGYKIYNGNGSKTYKDPKGRVTGVSHIDKSGRLIYRAKNRRTRTPRVMFEDPFLYAR